MNEAYSIQMLREARKNLDDLIQAADVDGDGIGELIATLPLVYRYLNLAWNSRQTSENELTRALKEEGHPKWLWGFPTDLELCIDDNDA